MTYNFYFFNILAFVYLEFFDGFAVAIVFYPVNV